MEDSISIFYSYAHEDERLRKKLDKHLVLLQRQGLISTWYDRKITAGTEWANEISTHLNNAQIILLLVSSSFLASDYCYSNEMAQALERHNAGTARVIPIILRPVDWQGAPFRQIQALPTDARPITGREWRNQDEAFADVAQGIRKVIEQLKEKIGPTTRSVHLVTNLEYFRFVQILRFHRPRHWIGNPSGSSFPDSQANTPVTWVSWNDAVAYCDWVGGCLPVATCETPAENAGTTIADTTEIGEWHDAGTEQCKQVCNPHTSRLKAMMDRDVGMPNIGFRCEPVKPLSPPRWISICDVTFQIGTDVEKFNLLADTYHLPQDLRQPILRRLVSPYKVPSFTISATCVTNEEYYMFTRAKGMRWPHHWDAKWLDYDDRPFPARLASRPVVNVSAEQAEIYCIWSGTRLPTWVEWERAASGLAKNLYPWGTVYSAARCNSEESGRGSLAAVDEYSLGDSPEGIRQLCGNVAEWVVGPKGKHEIRGGSYRMPCELWGLAYVFRQPDIGFHAPDVGFRVVR